MAEYEEIRTTLSRGFSLDNLRKITNLALGIVRDGAPKHPSVFIAIATTSHWIADAWDRVGLNVHVADRVERQVKPHLELLLDSADAPHGKVCEVLDDAATAFSEAMRQGLDSDL